VNNNWKQMLARTAWWLVWATLYRCSPRPLHGWRRFLLRCFGAQIGRGVHPYPSSRVWAPWNLVMGEGSCLGDRVDCYSVDRVVVGSHAVVSQDVCLCTATHDYTRRDFPLRTRPIEIGCRAWIAAGAFVGPGVRVGDGAVVGARAVVTKDIHEWTVVAGNPAKEIRKRVLREAPEDAS
jgi:putative colanic acid biosynthesis acetyltransferase WcaF